MCRPGESETRFTGELIASLTTCQSTSSGTSGVANGRATRKQTSVNGRREIPPVPPANARNLHGMYRPPSGASPRSTGARSEVAGFARLLRYLNEFRSSRVSRLALNHLQERGGSSDPSRNAATCSVQVRRALHNSVGARNQSRITTRHSFPEAFLPVWVETRRATAPALDHSNIFRSELQLLRGSRQMHDRHLAPQTHQQIVPGVDDASVVSSTRESPAASRVPSKFRPNV